MYREELERLGHELGLGDRSPEDVLHEAYLLGIKAHEDMVLAEDPTIYRLATQAGELAPARSWSSVKRFYTTAANARRAKVHAFLGESLKIQAGRVVWEDV
jgi:hypothetical protein